jgi:hypothetical protein
LTCCVFNQFANICSRFRFIVDVFYFNFFSSCCFLQSHYILLFVLVFVVVVSPFINATIVSNFHSFSLWLANGIYKIKILNLHYIYKSPVCNDRNVTNIYMLVSDLRMLFAFQEEAYAFGSYNPIIIYMTFVIYTGS